jgi:hypothetical protein
MIRVKMKPAGCRVGCLPSPADTPWMLLSMEEAYPEVYTKARPLQGLDQDDPERVKT